MIYYQSIHIQLNRFYKEDLKMKNLISYFDIPIIILVIYLAIIKWKKQNIYYEGCKEQLEINESKGIFDTNGSNSLRISDRYTKAILLLIIVCGILAIYNRLNGNMPNIFLILKALIIDKFKY